MILLDIIAGILTAVAGLGVFVGLDKLVGSFVFLALLFASLLFNHACAWANLEDNRFVAALVCRGKFDRNGAVRSLRIVFALIIFAICLYFLVKIYWLSLGLNLTVYDSFNQRIFYLVSQIALIFFGVFAVRTLQSQKQPDISLQWYRALAYLSSYQLLFFVFFVFSTYLPEAESERLMKIVDYGLFSVFIYLALISAEILTAAGRALVMLARNSGDCNLPVPFFITFFAAEDSIKRSLVRSIETISGVDVSRSEIVSFFTSIFEPVTIIALMVLWLITSVVIVPPGQEVIFKRFGQVCGARSFGPGLHFKLPWPFSSFELYDPQKVKTLNIGFEPDPKQRHILWTKSHSVNYFYLIVGDGVEIIAIDCQLMYRVDNLFKYITALQNPEEYITASAYKFLTIETVSTKFDEIISRDRQILAEQLKSKIQADLNARDMGVSIVEVVFLAMHPPLEVAEAYEDVISAQIDKLTYVLKANTENTHKLYMSKANAKSSELDAKSYAANTVSIAVGEAASFASRTLGYQIDPDLTKFRLRFDLLQKILAARPVYVIDKSIMREKDNLFLNMQN